MTTALRRPWGSPLVRRAVVLSGLAAGLWLAGSATSSAAAAEPVPPRPTAAVQGLTGALLTPVTSAVAPVAETTVSPVARTLAPVGERLVAPVLRAIEPVTAPVVGAVLPVLSPVVDPVVAPLRPVLQPVLRPAGVLGPVPAEPAATVVGSPSALDAPVLVPTGEEIAGVALPAGSGTPSGVVQQMAGASLDAPAPVPGGDDVPVPGPALPSGAPAPVASGPSSSDQHAADLPPAVTAVGLLALGAAADGARDAAADRALDPTFAPD